MICFAWAGFPQYAARCVGAFVKSTNEKVLVVATRPGVPIKGMEEVCNCPVVWVDGTKTDWIDSLPEMPRVLFVSGWINAGFNALRDRVRDNGGRVICCNDANYVFSLRELLRSLRFRLLMRRKYDAFFVPGKSGRKLLRFYGVPDRLIAEGLYAADATLFHDGLPLPQRDKNIIYVGQLCDRKNVLSVCRAFAKARGTGWTLKFFGAGPLESELRQLIVALNVELQPMGGQIELHPFMQPEELAKEYRKSRAFVLPSKEEHWGLVVHEAALSGCVLLLSHDIGAGADFLTEENGFSFDPLSESEMATAFERLLKMDDVALDRAQGVSVELAKRSSLDRFVDGASRLKGGFGYITGGGVGDFSHNANAYQKFVLVAKNLQGKLIVPVSAANDLPAGCDRAHLPLPFAPKGYFGLLWYYPRAVKATRGLVNAYCFSPSNEVGFVGVILASFLTHRRQWLFVWDPPGITVRNRKGVLSRLRCLLLDALFALAALRSKGVILNLHPGFLDRPFLRWVKSRCHSFANGTMADENRAASTGVEHVPYRLAVNAAFTQDKGAGEMAELFVRLYKTNDRFSLVWVGHGGDPDKIVDMLRASDVPDDKFKILSSVSHDDAMRALASASVAINLYHDIPSLRWNYILKIPEFMCLGIPVVSVKTPGTMAYIKNGENGVLYDATDAVRLHETILSLVSDAERLDAMSRRALQMAADFDWEKINDEIAYVISER